MRDVPSIQTLRGWLPAVVGVMGVVYGATSLRWLRQANERSVARLTPGGRRVFPVVALNVSSLALILIGSRIHGHWFIRVVRHSPAESIVIAGQFSCQALWHGVQQEGASDPLSESLSAATY